MAYETLRYDLDDRVATITLNRPERHNALSQQLCAEIVEAVRAADQGSGRAGARHHRRRHVMTGVERTGLY
jgi:enoyl-CoA hydratase/carnithine racemase